MISWRDKPIQQDDNKDGRRLCLVMTQTNWQIDKFWAIAQQQQQQQQFRKLEARCSRLKIYDNHVLSMVKISEL